MLIIVVLLIGFAKVFQFQKGNEKVFLTNKIINLKKFFSYKPYNVSTFVI